MKDYNKHNRFYIIKCHLEKDKDIINYLNRKKNKQAFLKELLRKEIDKNGTI